MWTLGNFTWTCRHWSLDLWTLLIHIVLADNDWLERFGAPLRPQSLDLDFVCICWIACQRQICWICSQEGIWILPILLQFFGVNIGLQVLGAPFCRQDPRYMLFLSNYVQCLNDWLAYLKLTKITYYIFFSHNVVISITRGNSQICRCEQNYSEIPSPQKTTWNK